MRSAQSVEVVIQARSNILNVFGVEITSATNLLVVVVIVVLMVHQINPILFLAHQVYQRRHVRGHS